MFTFTKLSSDGNQAIGELTLEGKTYTAVSGGHGRGELPEGTYRVDVRGVVEGGHLGAAFKAGGVGFFIPIEHLTDGSRTGLGIHPDGNVPGTEGCIGVSAADSRRFLSAWKAMSLAKRPTTLTVVG